jgi:hypothetical protein
MAYIHLLIDDLETQLSLAQLTLSVLKTQVVTMREENALKAHDNQPTSTASSPPMSSKSSGDSPKQHKTTGDNTRYSPEGWNTTQSTSSWSPQPLHRPAWLTSTNMTPLTMQHYSATSEPGQKSWRTTRRKTNNCWYQETYNQKKELDLWDDPWKTKQYKDQLEED